MADADVIQSMRTLLDKQACSDLVLSLGRAYDRIDREMLLSLFWPDAEIEYATFKGGPDGLADWALGIVSKMSRTQHILTNVMVNVFGDTAASETCFSAYHQQGPDDGEFLFVSGRYMDRFARRDGVWKMSGRYAVTEFRMSAPLRQEHSAATVLGLRSREDYSYAHMLGGR